MLCRAEGIAPTTDFQCYWMAVPSAMIIGMSIFIGNLFSCGFFNILPGLKTTVDHQFPPTLLLINLSGRSENLPHRFPGATR